MSPRRLAAVCRIETMLPLVRAQRPLEAAELEEVMRTAGRRRPVELERYASIAEGRLSHPTLTGPALLAQAAKDNGDLMGSDKLKALSLWPVRVRGQGPRGWWPVYP